MEPVLFEIARSGLSGLALEHLAPPAGRDWVRFDGCSIEVGQGFIGNPTRIEGHVVCLRGAHRGETAEVTFPADRDNRTFASAWALLMEGEYQFSGLNELGARLTNDTVFEVSLREHGQIGGLWTWLSLSEFLAIAPDEAQTL